MQNSKCFLKHIALGTLASALVAQNTFAADADYSSITTGVSFTTVVTGMLAVGALVATVLAARKGIKMLLAMFN